MRALALPYGIAYPDAARWSICFAAVTLAHGAAALALLSAPAASNFEAGAPVVLIELSEAAFTVPPNDLAPGPPEPEVAATPPPTEDTKPPERQAEIALPKPEPPKPEPPAEARPATALPSVAMLPPAAAPSAGAAVQPSAALLRHWQSELVAHIERFKRYPAAARARGDQGLARVAFTIDRNGKVRGSRIVQSSGSPDLDQESLAILTRAQPMPRPPDQLPPSELSFVVPIRFNIR
jgi:periplasmic protein TonB